MAVERIEGVIVKGGFYLEPISSMRIDRDAYSVGLDILRSKYEIYRSHPPILFPLLRGGARGFLNISGSFRRILKDGKQDIDYVPIKISRYNTRTIGSEGQLAVDEHDIMQAFYALQNHSEGLIIDDVFDRGHSATAAQELLLPSGKPVPIVTLYTKSEENQTTNNVSFYVQDFKSRVLGGRRFRPWLVFP